MFRPHEVVNPRYFIIVLNGPHGRHQAEAAATGSAHPHVNLGDIKKYSIPLPPTAEQEQIVAEVERCLSVIDELKVVIEANIKRADRLRQSILEQAFSGQPVLENPNTSTVSISKAPAWLENVQIQPISMLSEYEESIQEEANTMANLIEALTSASGL